MEEKRIIVKKFVKERAWQGYWYELRCLSCSKIFEIGGYQFNMGIGKYCSKRCYGNSKMTGKNVKCLVCNSNFYVRNSQSSKYCSRLCLRIAYQNEGNPSWNGGTSKFTRTERVNLSHTAEYKEWRKAIFERDNYACIQCGKRSKSKEPIILHADHIKPYSLYPELKLKVSNGRTLCINCHRATPTYGSNVRYAYGT